MCLFRNLEDCPATAPAPASPPGPDNADPKPEQQPKGGAEVKPGPTQPDAPTVATPATQPGVERRKALLRALIAVVKRGSKAPFHDALYVDFNAGSVSIPGVFKHDDVKPWLVKDMISELASVLRASRPTKTRLKVEFKVYTDRTSMRRRDPEDAQECGQVTSRDQLADCRAIALAEMLRESGLDPQKERWVSVRGAGHSDRFCKRWPGCSDEQLAADRRIEILVSED